MLILYREHFEHVHKFEFFDKFLTILASFLLPCFQSLQLLANNCSFEELANDSSSAILHFLNLSDDFSNDLPGLLRDDLGVVSVLHKEKVCWGIIKYLQSQAKFLSVNLSLYCPGAAFYCIPR